MLTYENCSNNDNSNNSAYLSIGEMSPIILCVDILYVVATPSRFF